MSFEGKKDKQKSGQIYDVVHSRNSCKAGKNFKSNGGRTINIYALMSRWGYTTIAISNFVIIMVESEEKANGIRKTGVLLKVTPLGSLH